MIIGSVQGIESQRQTENTLRGKAISRTGSESNTVNNLTLIYFRAGEQTPQDQPHIPCNMLFLTLWVAPLVLNTLIGGFRLPFSAMTFHLASLLSNSLFIGVMVVRCLVKGTAFIVFCFVAFG